MFSVLYVDDEPDLLEIGKIFLERSGDFQIDMAVSATKALSKMKATEYDAIISDYQMPGMDGIAFLKHLRGSGSQLPFILFTGRGREEIVIEALNNGADYYLQKGSDVLSQFAELSHKVRLAVERRRTENALLESERHYRAVVEDQTEYICRFRPDGTKVFVNEAFCKAMETPCSEIVGTRIWPRTPDEEVRKIDALLAALTPEHPLGTYEHRVIPHGGEERWQQWSYRAIFDDHGKLAGYQAVGRDITERKRAEDALNRRLIALTEPLESSEIAFTDLFNVDEIQKLQDAFCEAMGVAALITLPDGTPVTRPGNFTNLCRNIIRTTEEGLKNCIISDAEIGRSNPDGPIIRNCLSAGLSNAGASIIVGGKHVANWLIGQVKTENIDEAKLIDYARHIGADEMAFRQALAGVPTMTQEQFERVARFLFLLANELSLRAYQNVQQARFITERKKAEEELKAAYGQLAAVQEEWRARFDGIRQLQEHPVPEAPPAKSGK